MTIKMPRDVIYIINILKENGFEAYAVGGCVRDKILNKEPSDWDIATSAMPKEIKRLFKRTVDTGIKHGTITVLLDDGHYELTTYRIDGEYADNRRPLSVDFTNNLKEDLKRRDFTINAMAYNDEDGLVDLFGGISDIENKIIRCVGDADTRFNEDGLRMLRAIRFSSQLGFDIHSDTYESIIKNKDLINNISAERIRCELTKILMSSNVSKFLLLNETGLLNYIMPEFIPNIGCSQEGKWHIHNVDKHIILATSTIEKDAVLRWTMLLHDIGKAYVKFTDEDGNDHFGGHDMKGKELADKILKRLKFDTKSMKKIEKLIEFHSSRMKGDEYMLRHLIAEIGDDMFLDLLKVQEADARAKREEVYIEFKKEKPKILNIYNKIKEEKQCTKISMLAINGRDILKLGFTEGKEVGNILDALFKMVLEDPSLNTRSQLECKAEEVILRLKNNNEINIGNEIKENK